MVEYPVSIYRYWFNTDIFGILVYRTVLTPAPKFDIFPKIRGEMTAHMRSRDNSGKELFVQVVYSVDSTQSEGNTPIKNISKFCIFI
jgi:hypothetical protein